MQTKMLLNQVPILILDRVGQFIAVFLAVEDTSRGRGQLRGEHSPSLREVWGSIPSTSIK